MSKDVVKRIDTAILEIDALKRKYAKIDTMFISKALDEAIRSIGWTYATLMGDGIIKKK